MTVSIRDQYERWPYPTVPLVASVPRREVTQLHVEHLRDRCGLPPGPERPRIWIAGCGTHQPYVWAVANPRAQIVASDISRASLRRARWHCAMHLVRNVRFTHGDLNDHATLPDGEFDVVECHGVLMNLRDPAAALRALASRVAPEGVLRLMVYPWHSRRRIFQLQRVARLLGFVPLKADHPRRFAAIVRDLPAAHPLRAAFESYADSSDPAGIVDGFLHVGDRGFTALHLDALLQQAGLRAACWFHRPWAQPGALAQALKWQASDATLLHHADLWQELRGNFVPCAVRADAPTPRREVRFNPAVRGGTWTGLSLGSRLTDGRARFSGSEVRALRAWCGGGARVDDELAARAFAAGVVLGGPSRRAEHAHAPAADWEPRLPLEVGAQVPNPLYEALFSAWRAADPEEEAARWGGFAAPLEEDGQWGLTPLGSWRRCVDGIRAWRGRAATTVNSFAELRYAGEHDGVSRMRAWLHKHAPPRTDWRDDEARELWVLLGSWEQPFLDAQPA